MKLNRQTLRKMILKEMADSFWGDQGNVRARAFMNPQYPGSVLQAIKDPMEPYLDLEMDPQEYDALRNFYFSLQNIDQFMHNQQAMLTNETFMMRLKPQIEECLMTLGQYPYFVKRPTDIDGIKIYLNNILNFLNSKGY